MSSLEDLYRLVDPNFPPNTVDTFGQLFIRKAEDGLYMVCGLVSAKDLPEECIVPVSMSLEVISKEDISGKSVGRSIDGILKSPFWRVPRKS